MMREEGALDAGARADLVVTEHGLVVRIFVGGDRIENGEEVVFGAQNPACAPR